MSLFDEKALMVMDALIAKYGLKDYQAAAVPGSFGRETGGFQFLREMGQPRGRGGYGWGQWTGSRRVDFLNYCHDRGYDWASDEGNLNYFLADLDKHYRFLPPMLKRSTNLHGAVEEFEHYYEGAGVVAMADRYQWAMKALNAYRNARKDKTA